MSEVLRSVAQRWAPYIDPYIAIAKALVTQPRGLLRDISDSGEQWQVSLRVAGAAIVINALVRTLVEQDVGEGFIALVYLALMVPFYTAALHFLSQWLLQLDVPWRKTSTALNYAMITAALMSIPYVSAVAVIYFFTLVFFLIQELYGAAKERAVVTFILYLLCTFVFEAVMARLGLALG